jgi:hypothetical protein
MKGSCRGSAARIALLASLAMALSACDIIYDMHETSWRMTGTITVTGDGLAELKLAAISDENVIVSQVLPIGSVSDFSLDIDARDVSRPYSAATSDPQYIDIVVWADSNRNDRRDSGESYDLAKAASAGSFFSTSVSFGYNIHYYEGNTWYALAKKPIPTAMAAMDGLAIATYGEWSEY